MESTQNFLLYNLSNSSTSDEKGSCTDQEQKILLQFIQRKKREKKKNCFHKIKCVNAQRTNKCLWIWIIKLPSAMESDIILKAFSKNIFTTKHLIKVCQSSEKKFCSSFSKSTWVEIIRNFNYYDKEKILLKISQKQMKPTLLYKRKSLFFLLSIPELWLINLVVMSSTAISESDSMSWI